MLSPSTYNIRPGNGRISRDKMLEDQFAQSIRLFVGTIAPPFAFTTTANSSFIIPTLLFQLDYFVNMANAEEEINTRWKTLILNASGQEAKKYQVLINYLV